MKTLLAAGALVLSMTASNAATDTPRSDVLVGGPIWAPSQNYVYCFFFNGGSTNINLVSAQIFEEGSTTALNSNIYCSSTITPNQTCFATVGEAPDVPLSCRLTFSGPATAVRGSVQLYDSDNNPLATVELR
jgi:hypothetical protein